MCRVPRGVVVPGTVKYLSANVVTRKSEFECEYAAECLPFDDYNDGGNGPIAPRSFVATASQRVVYPNSDIPNPRATQPIA